MQSSSAKNKSLRSFSLMVSSRRKQVPFVMAVTGIAIVAPSRMRPTIPSATEVRGTSWLRKYEAFRMRLFDLDLFSELLAEML